MMCQQPKIVVFIFLYQPFTYSVYFESINPFIILLFLQHSICNFYLSYTKTTHYISFSNINFYYYKLLFLFQLEMKKVYDWDIQLAVAIRNFHKTLNVVCSVHTSIHQLKIQICKQLDLSILDTEMQILDLKSKSLKSTSTLLQNDITKNCKIFALITRFNTHNKPQTINSLSSQKNKKVPNMQGLTLICVCNNLNCLNFDQQVEVNIGYGTFDIRQIIGNIKCELCPYKNQNLRPSMKCKNIKVSQCWYQIDDLILEYESIQKQVKGKFKKTKIQKIISNQIGQNIENLQQKIIIKSL